MLFRVLNRKCGLICALRKESSAFSFSLAISLLCASERSHWLITRMPVLKTKTSRKMARLNGFNTGRTLLGLGRLGGAIAPPLAPGFTPIPGWKFGELLGKVTW